MILSKKKVKSVLLLQVEDVFYMDRDRNIEKQNEGLRLELIDTDPG